MKKQINKNKFLAFIYFALVLLFFSCSETKNDEFKVSIEYFGKQNIIGKYVYISKILPTRKIDSILVKTDTQIEFTLTKQSIEDVYSLSIDSLIIEDPTFFSGTKDLLIRLEDNEDNFSTGHINVSVEGGDKEQAYYNEFSKGLAPIVKNIQESIIEWRALKKENSELPSPKTRNSIDSIESLYRAYRKQRMEHYENYVSKNTNATALYILNTTLKYSFNAYELEDMLKTYPENYKTLDLYLNIKNQIDKMKPVEIGALAPDFTVPDVDGKLISLSSFKGKYVLVDFWASWCGPCRKENPNVVKAYNTFKDKGFAVLGVSLDDSKTRDKWLKAIEDDNLPWKQTSNLMGWKDPIPKLYNVSGIPYPFLIGPDGKIIAKGPDITEGKLMPKLEEIFLENNK